VKHRFSCGFAGHARTCAVSGAQIKNRVAHTNYSRVCVKIWGTFWSDSIRDQERRSRRLLCASSSDFVATSTTAWLAQARCQWLTRCSSSAECGRLESVNIWCGAPTETEARNWLTSGRRF